MPAIAILRNGRRFRLMAVELRIPTVQCHQRCMRTLFRNHTIIQHYDLVEGPGSENAVSYHDRRLVLKIGAEVAENSLLRSRVHSRKTFIQK